MNRVDTAPRANPGDNAEFTTFCCLDVLLSSLLCVVIAVQARHMGRSPPTHDETNLPRPSLLLAIPSCTGPQNPSETSRLSATTSRHSPSPLSRSETTSRRARSPRQRRHQVGQHRKHRALPRRRRTPAPPSHGKTLTCITRIEDAVTARTIAQPSICVTAGRTSPALSRHIVLQREAGLRRRLRYAEKARADNAFDAFLGAMLLHTRIRESERHVQILLKELERTRSERDEACAVKKMALEERNRAAAERDEAMREKNAALTERDAAVREKDAAISERDAACNERDLAITGRSEAIADRDSAVAERDSAIAERDREDAAVVEQGCSTAHDSVVTKRDGASQETAILERDEALKQKNELVAQLQTLSAKKDAAMRVLVKHQVEERRRRRVAGEMMDRIVKEQELERKEHEEQLNQSEKEIEKLRRQVEVLKMLQRTPRTIVKPDEAGTENTLRPQYQAMKVENERLKMGLKTRNIEQALSNDMETALVQELAAARTRRA